MNRLNSAFDYFRFCEILFEEWGSHQFSEDEILKDLFEMEYSPEPYFVVKNGNNPLYLLDNKPCLGVHYQQIIDSKIKSYFDFSEKFKKEKVTVNMDSVLANGLDFCDQLGYDSLVNIKSIPFHCNKSNKSILLKSINKSWTLYVYQQVLKMFLIDKPVLIFSNSNLSESLSKNTIQKNDWLIYQSDLAGVNIGRLQMKPITKKNNKMTSTLFSYQNKYIA